MRFPYILFPYLFPVMGRGVFWFGSNDSTGQTGRLEERSLLGERVAAMVAPPSGKASGSQSLRRGTSAYYAALTQSASG